MIPTMVLAAGKSTRLSTLTGGLPKPLMPVAGVPVLGWNLRWLASYGVQDVWINVHYQAEAVCEAIGDGAGYGMRVNYSHEPELLGTAGGWKRVANAHAGPWLVVYGDNLTRLDLNRLIAAWQPGTALAALFDAGKHTNTGIYGGFAIVDEGRITGFVEGANTSDDRLINAGVYVLDAAIAKEIGEGSVDFGRDVFPTLVEAGLLYGHILEENAFCLGLDTPEHFATGARLVSEGAVVL